MHRAVVHILTNFGTASGSLFRLFHKKNDEHSNVVLGSEVSPSAWMPAAEAPSTQPHRTLLWVQPCCARAEVLSRMPVPKRHCGLKPHHGEQGFTSCRAMGVLTTGDTSGSLLKQQLLRLCTKTSGTQWKKAGDSVI